MRVIRPLVFVLTQCQNNNERVIAYAGRTLNKHERNYSINEILVPKWKSRKYNFEVFTFSMGVRKQLGATYKSILK